MVVLKLEMWPKGQQSKAYSLGTMKIALDPHITPTDTLRSYTWFCTRRNEKGLWKKGHIGGHNPKQRGPWDLLYRILRDAVGYRNP